MMNGRTLEKKMPSPVLNPDVITVNIIAVKIRYLVLFTRIKEIKVIFISIAVTIRILLPIVNIIRARISTPVLPSFLKKIKA